jgi:glycosyltransferase involved in cell wall biosynthesis
MRIVYWNTSCLQPEIEAISKEIFGLASHFRNSLIFSVSKHIMFRCSLRRRYIGFNIRCDPLLRVFIPYIERFADLNHVYGEFAPWTFYKTLTRKPLVLTIASERGDPHHDFLDRCRKIIVQTEALRRELLALGISHDKIEWLFPGVDLARFRPAVQNSDVKSKPHVLFATAPRTTEEMEGRGVPLLLNAAQDTPEVRYHLLYRQWRTGYTSLHPTRELIARQALRNVTLTDSIVEDMPAVYNQHHFTIVPYTRPDGGKECPNSLIEGLACGLPALVSSACRIADFVERQRCGVVFDPTPSCLVSAIERATAHYHELSKQATVTAHAFFSQESFFAKTAKIYDEIAS